MYNSFKHPFDADEDDTIITLDPFPAASPLSDQAIAFNAHNQEATARYFSNNPAPSASSSENSMFNPLDPNLSQHSEGAFDESEEPPLLEGTLCAT
jgi:hypothetical protein